jgi:uncharacterized membrane protein
MHRFGTFLVWLGVILTAVGLVFGFGAMFTDADHQAVNLLGLVPLGFMALLTGVVMVLFSRPSTSSGADTRRREPD